jgi:hypothetical protein
MIRRILVVAFLFAIFTGSAFAADIDRHGNYTEKDASGAAADKCKNFSGTDDNRSPCMDWCSAYKTADPTAACSCDDGACPPDATIAPQAAAAPAAR